MWGGVFRRVLFVTVCGEDEVALNEVEMGVVMCGLPCVVLRGMCIEYVCDAVDCLLVSSVVHFV